MKRYLLGVIALAAVAGGCSSNKGAAAAKPALTPIVTDIAPTPPAPVYVAPQQPVQPVTLASNVAVEPVAAAAPMAAGGAYTVQRGDTLYKLARQHYGDGKQWSKIAAANPGLSPSSLRVGQKIVIP